MAVFESRATWRNWPKRIINGWNVIKVLERSPGFVYGTFILRGFDNTKPNESKSQCERRIADRFGCKIRDLVLEIVTH